MSSAAVVVLVAVPAVYAVARLGERDPHREYRSNRSVRAIPPQ
jgi:hypothetical protein